MASQTVPTSKRESNAANAILHDGCLKLNSDVNRSANELSNRGVCAAAAGSNRSCNARETFS